MQMRHQREQKGPKLNEAKKKNEWQEVEGSTQMQNRWHFLNGKDDLCLKQSAKSHNFCNLCTRMHNFQQFFWKENILQAQIFNKQELKTYDGSHASGTTAWGVFQL